MLLLNPSVRQTLQTGPGHMVIISSVLETLHSSQTASGYWGLGVGVRDLGGVTPRRFDLATSRSWRVLLSFCLRSPRLYIDSTSFLCLVFSISFAFFRVSGGSIVGSALFPLFRLFEIWGLEGLEGPAVKILRSRSRRGGRIEGRFGGGYGVPGGDVESL